MRFLGVDLSWATGARAAPSGLVALDDGGTVIDAGWRTGVDQVVAWLDAHAHQEPGLTIACVDAPLVVENEAGGRACERLVGQRYGRWKVSANSTNLASPRLAGVELRERAEQHGWRYDPGWEGPPSEGAVVLECYPYTTLVGAAELGYDRERPTYKRRPRSLAGLSPSQWRERRATNCDDLVGRVNRLANADPPLHLESHPVTAALVAEPSPHDGNHPGRVKDVNAAYKQREDLLDAALCAWTAALWVRHGTDRCQILGDLTEGPRGATILAPARDDQRQR